MDFRARLGALCALAVWGCASNDSSGLAGEQTGEEHGTPGGPSAAAPGQPPPSAPSGSPTNPPPPPPGATPDAGGPRTDSGSGPPGAQAYRDYGAFSYVKGGAPWLSQSVIDAGGKVGYARECPLAAAGPDWSACTGWAMTDLSNLRGVGNETYWGYGAFTYSRAGEQYVSQSIIAEGGQTGWARECPVGSAGVGWNACGTWGMVDLRNLRGVGNESYRDYGAFLISTNGAQVLSQSLVSADGTIGYARSCPIDDVNGVLWGSCSGWQTVSLSNIRGVGNESYTGYGAFSFTSGGALKVSQSLVDLRGTVAYGRDCPIDANGDVLWGSCSTWGAVDLTHLR